MSIVTQSRSAKTASSELWDMVLRVAGVFAVAAIVAIMARVTMGPPLF